MENSLQRHLQRLKKTTKSRRVGLYKTFHNKYEHKHHKSNIIWWGEGEQAEDPPMTIHRPSPKAHLQLHKTARETSHQ